ncbi:MAG TPA: hypothetical protein VMU06_18575 [Stellaceae bacterium]|jgi:hypothetical protein|nr:hypothetical protein [Stellaceae bacterium]
MSEDRALLRISRLLERIAERAAGQGWWDVQALAGAAALAAEERAGVSVERLPEESNVVQMRR